MKKETASFVHLSTIKAIDVIESFDMVGMFNPFDKKSRKVCSETLEAAHFWTDQYETHYKESDCYRYPCRVYIPSKQMTRVMIDANLKFSKKDKI